MENREQMLAQICSEDHRVQYDDKDKQRIYDLASQFTEAAMITIEALGNYSQALAAPVDETSADKMKGARYGTVEAWTAMQAVVSKMAYVLRIDGDEAFKLALEAAKTDEPPKLQGL